MPHYLGRRGTADVIDSAAIQNADARLPERAAIADKCVARRESEKRLFPSSVRYLCSIRLIRIENLLV